MGCTGCIGKVVDAVKRLAHGVAGLTKAELGFDPAPPEVVEARRAKCRACPQAVPCRSNPKNACWCGPVWDGVWGVREGCGCSIKHKTLVASESCPRDEWGPVEPAK